MTQQRHDVRDRLVRNRLVALAASAYFIASCGGPASPSVTGAQTLTPFTATPATVTPVAATATATPFVTAAPRPSPDGAACRLSEPVRVTAPASLMALHGGVAGVTDRGELIVFQSHLLYFADTLSLLDPRTGTVTPVVSRPAPKSPEAATSAIGGFVTGNAGWVVWEEVGFWLEHSDWRMWALDRATGKVREVASFDPGTDGQVAPGWASDLSLLGDIVTWSAPAMLGPNRAGQRIYVADLRPRTVRRLDTEANWPSMMSAHEISAATEVGTDPATGKVLALPTTISLPGGRATPQDWMKPAVLLSQASSPAGTVVTRLLRQATADDSVAIADVMTHDALSGLTRTFALPNGWGPVVAGTGFIAWSDQRHLWILPSGQVEPTMLLAIPDDSAQVQVFANGAFVFWRSVGLGEYDWTTNRMASVICP